MRQEQSVAILTKYLDLMKVERRRRQWLSYQRLLRLNERKLLPVVNRYMNLMIRDARKGLGSMTVANTPKKNVERLTDWKKLEREGIAIFKPALFAILEQGGRAVVDRAVIKQEHFDPNTTAAVDWATDHSAELVTNVTEETMMGIRVFVTDAMAAGQSIGDVAKNVRPVVGLTEPHARAVGRKMTDMIAEGIPDDKIRSAIERYANKLHRYRAHMIARTETAFALSEGQLEGYQQMGVSRVEWVADPQCCEICAANNGTTYDINEAFGLIPAHPQCECCFIPVRRR